MTLADFLTRWTRSGGAERANYGLFLHELTTLLGVTPPDATTDDPARDAYVLERAVTFDEGAGKKSTGRIDLYKRGCFVLETKQGTSSPDEQQAAEKAEAVALGFAAAPRRRGHALRGTAKWDTMMQQAYRQAMRYVRALPATEPHPPFLVVVDVGFCLDLYANFSGVADQYVPYPDARTNRIPLADLAQEPTRALLAQLWTDPAALDPSRRAAKVTRKLAERLAVLSAQLETAKHPSDVVAQFLMRCLFTMFSEDVELIPKGSFTGLLKEYLATPELQAMLPDALENLWHRMDAGGFSSELKARLRRFNGNLFHNATALPLSETQTRLLLEAASADWTTVEPAIFGTLLERALDPTERHSLGAHYTPRRYVERLVLPTVMEPLRQEWAAAQTASARRAEESDVKGAREELVKFLRRLTSVRILDPACGSGNFLYVTLEHLKRLEGEVLTALERTGASGLLDLSGSTTVSPRQLLGIELNPRAAAIADVVLRIGYLQWHIRTHGLTHLAEPLLDSFQSIENRDAVLVKTGTTYAPAEWPDANFIVGNPPFVGAARMRDALGDTYVEALRKTYNGRVPDSADLVMYWWQKAATIVAAGKSERFGFITTNSLRQTFNRRVLAPFLEGETPALALTLATPDHPWVDATDGAAVRVAFTVAERAMAAMPEGRLLTVETETSAADDDAAEVTFATRTGRIQADLSVGADLDSAQPLRANSTISNRGFELGGAGFIVTEAKASDLGLGTVPGLAARIPVYRNGRDLTDKPRGVRVIDLFGLTSDEVLTRFPAVYQHLLETVKPERDTNRDAILRANWWLHRRLRTDLRAALVGLPRYIATVETAKHRVFQFLDAEVLPDNKLIVFALEDAYHLGVLSSRLHVTWALATGSHLGVGNDPVYVKSRCFDPFPFPDATEAQQAEIRKLAEQLDGHRKRQQAANPVLTLTDLYNVVEKLRAGQPLTPKEAAVKDQGLAVVVLDLHRQLDAAVAAAYGWPTDLPDAEILTRLVALNAIRRQEEADGAVRWLRPTYQAPGATQAALALPATTQAAAKDAAAVGLTVQPWPTGLAEQAQLVQAAVRQAPAPLTAEQVAARFRGAGPARVRPLLETLAGLGVLRLTETGHYAV